MNQCEILVNVLFATSQAGLISSKIIFAYKLPHKLTNDLQTWDHGKLGST